MKRRLKSAVVFQREKIAVTVIYIFGFYSNSYNWQCDFKKKETPVPFVVFVL